jgi:hypothetical protein
VSYFKSKYNDLILNLKDFAGNIDPELILKVLYLEKKLPDAPPRVELKISLKPGVSAIKKQNDLSVVFGFQTSKLNDHEVLAVGRMSMQEIATIAKDSEITMIAGNATPASF